MKRQEEKRGLESAEKRFCRSIDKFVDLKKSEKVIFRFNNIDPQVCKKSLGQYVYEAFQLREYYSIKQKHGKWRFLIITFN